MNDYEDGYDGDEAQRQADIGSEIAEREADDSGVRGWSRALPTHKQNARVQTTVTVRRFIDIWFDEPIAIVGKSRGSVGWIERKGRVTGFTYSDGEQADVDPHNPEDGYISRIHFRYHGEMYLRDSVPMAKPGYTFDGPAAKAVEEWVMAHRDWWKVPS